jgi:aspartyl/asparaginyl beta-hydroxylase (cupin superfamily)
MKPIERINQVVKLLSDNEEELIEYLKETQFDFSFFDKDVNPDIYKEVFYYDFRKPNAIIENEVIKQLLSYDFVTYLSYNIFPPGVRIDKHKDPDPGEEIYQLTQHHGPFSGNPIFRRLHFSLEDSPENCFMIFDDKKYVWKKGELQFFDVHNFTHEFYNNSNDFFSLLLIDVLVGE